MLDINSYIEASKTMTNTSDGGSAAYHFDDVVLVKYKLSLKYGIAREDEEKIATAANEKRAKGVRTPAHLAIKREVDEESSICWVLQERAKGQSFNNYCYNNDIKTQLAMQSKIANAPLSHYKKLISDVCELFNFGLELKPKNIYYDEDLQNGGFTIIDLLCLKGDPFNPNSLKDILYLETLVQGIYNCSRISFFNKKATEEDKIKSNAQYYMIRKKIFQAMEQVIPNFKNQRKWVLRSMPFDTLEYFNQNGIEVGNLTLDDQECEQFSEVIKNIIASSINKIISGQNKLWEIYANEIRIDLSKSGMQYAWIYHKDNNRNPQEFTGDFAEYDYKRACEKDLEQFVIERFNLELLLLEDNNNEYLIQAKKDYDEIQARNTGRK